ncbi:methyl-accepting chemotaxis protein [Rubrivivax sp. RP6-9]|uniref:methyl-accepting chemotaxis protein n=1 Tax=Rubrivivax sp. RP6-9 TaxID=3415750 RepID=UPI003CC53681
MKFENLRIATKLWLAVGLLVAAMSALIVFAAVRANQSQTFADRVLTLTETKIRLATRWSQMTEAAVQRAVVGAVNTDATIGKMLDDANNEAVAGITELHKQLKTLPLSDAETALMQKIATLRQAVLDTAGEVTKLKLAGDLDGARAAATQKFVPAVAPYLGALGEFVKLQEAASAAARAQIASDRSLTVKIAAIVAVLMIAGMLVGTTLLVRSIRTPLLDAVDLAGRIAEGDLGSKRMTTRGDEFGALQRALLAMNDSLARTVGRVRLAADSIQTASTEIATGNIDLSQRTEQTASNLQRTASAMGQLTDTVAQSAASARTANQLASSAADVANRGGAVVSQVVSTMDEINAASKRIADIIGTIDGIAFQTNILALNAAVEAARAGEQGRGFAVVAGEVRSLAQRSAEAAREIKSLIGASVERVESGARLVADAGSTMTEIVASVQRVSDIIGDISAAAAEQSTGIAQVNGAVGQLDQMTQQNAALVEESAAAAESLREQSRQLAGVVAGFHLDASPGRSALPAAGAAPVPAPVPAPAATPARATPAAVARTVIAQVRTSARQPAATPAAARVPAPAPSPSPSAPAGDDWESF